MKYLKQCLAHFTFRKLIKHLTFQKGCFSAFWLRSTVVWGLLRWYSHLFKNFPQFVVIHIVKGFGVVNKAELDVSLGEGKGNPFQYSCLENPVDRGAWWAAVHRVA